MAKKSNSKAIKHTSGNLRTVTTVRIQDMRAANPTMTTSELVKRVVAIWGAGDYFDMVLTTPRLEWRELERAAQVKLSESPSAEALGKALLDILPHWVEWLATGDTDAPLVQ